MSRSPAGAPTQVARGICQAALIGCEPSQAGDLGQDHGSVLVAERIGRDKMQVPVILVLDPAIGTGTRAVQAIDLACRSRRDLLRGRSDARGIVALRIGDRHGLLKGLSLEAGGAGDEPEPLAARRAHQRPSVIRV